MFERKSKDYNQTGKKESENKDHERTKNSEYKETKVNEQYGLY